MHASSFNVARIFGDNMVLQRDKPVKVWGECERPQTIRVFVDGREAASTQAARGAWQVTLPAIEARRSLVLRVAGENEEEALTFRNVAVGDVWIAGGQSNMEFPLEFDAEGKQAIAGADNPDIRFYDCPKIKFEGQAELDDMSAYGFWRPCDRANAPFYSAVGFYFANKIYERYQVPIGIAGCNWGGTTASTWLDESYLAADDRLSVYLQEYEAALQNLDLAAYNAAERKAWESGKRPLLLKYMRYIKKHTPETFLYPLVTAIFKATRRNPLPVGPRSENRPGGLYHMMVETIAGYTARGVIWYQGEADDVKAGLYARLFSAVIRCWRAAWEDDLPFLFVQLAPYERWFSLYASDFTLLREQQQAVSKSVDGAYMISIMDAGSRLDIHPKRKRPVGERLALLARGKVYGETILCEAPEAMGVQVQDDRLAIPFTNAGDGLFVKGSALKSLEVLVDGKEVKDPIVSIDHDTVWIKIDGLRAARALEVRFAYRNYAEVNLYNSADLPAKPFRWKAGV